MVQTFALMRIVVGGASWLAPRFSGKLSGFDADRNPQSTYWTRLFGARDVALGVGALQTDGASRRRVIQLTAACDVADFASSLLGRRSGDIPVGATLLSGGIALGALTVAMLASAEAGEAAA